MREMVQERMEWVQDRLTKRGYAPFPITFDIKVLGKGTAGVAHIFKQSFSISIDYLKDCTKEVIKQTVPHEICHLYVTRYYPSAKQHHGPEFRMMMNLLGLDGKTKHAMQLVTKASPGRKMTKYVYRTVGSNIEVLLSPQKHRKQQAYAQRTGNSLYVHSRTRENLLYTKKMRKV